MNLDAAELKAASRDWPSLTVQDDALVMFELIMRGAIGPPGVADDAPRTNTMRLSAPPELTSRLHAGDQLALRNREGLMLGAMHVIETGEDSKGHHVTGGFFPVQLPPRYAFASLRQTAEELRGKFEIAFLATQPIHRATFDALMATGKKTLIIGAPPPNADPGDTYPTVRCWLAAVERSAGQMGLSLWPIPEAESPEWRALAEMVAENCGCPKLLSRQDLPGAGDHDEVLRLLREGHAVPEALTFPEVARELAAAYPPPGEQGLTIFFTGLSGSGKSTIANALREALIERGRRVTLLDGDLVRHHLSSELGFSREHRELNITRIGYVAAEITRHRGVAICAPIAPYEEVRARVRAMVEAAGKFVLVYVATPLDVCEGRDVKGLYAKARSGIIPNFTGVSDAYEPPASTEIVIDTAALSPAEAVETIMVWLAERGYISKRQRLHQ